MFHLISNSSVRYIRTSQLMFTRTHYRSLQTSTPYLFDKHVSFLFLFCFSFQPSSHELTPHVFAVTPLSWCPHLTSVQNNPNWKPDINSLCSNCNHSSENWVCLSCYAVSFMCVCMNVCFYAYNLLNNLHILLFDNLILCSVSL